MFEKFTNQLKTNRWILLIFSLGLLLRLFLLNKVPVGILHDELYFILNSKSIALTGRLLPLTATSIISWFEKDYDVVISEIPSFVIMPWIAFTKLTLFNVRFPYAIMSSLSIILVFLIVKNLIGKREAIFSALVYALNPWSIHIGRTALEVNIAIFFFLLAMYTLVKFPAKKIYFTLSFLLLMFLSYFGAKLQYVLLLPIFFSFKWWDTRNKKEIIKALFIGLTVGFAIFIAYFITLRYQPAGLRSRELIIFNPSRLSEVVNEERRISIIDKGSYIFTNKATVLVKKISDIYINAFSASQLFSKGETVAVYSTWNYGQFHFLDFFFVFAGLITLFISNKKVFTLFVAIILTAPLVSSIDIVEETYAIRAFPMFPVLSMLSGIGLSHLIFKMKRINILPSLVFSAYLISFLYFYNYYLLRYPVISAERWFFGERLVINYSNFANDTPAVGKIIVSTVEDPKDVFLKFAFYTGRYNTKEDINMINDKLKAHDFSFGKVKFVGGCSSAIDTAINDIYIYQSALRCRTEDISDVQILDLKDSGSVFRIENDIVCQNTARANYYSLKDFNELEIENKPLNQFCSKWIAKI